MEKDLYRGRREDPKAGPRAPDKTGKPITPGKMMASAAGLLNKSFKEAKEKQEYDYEGDMAMSQLKSIIANAQRIHDMLERDTNIPEWVQSKITLAEDYITTASNYMQGEMSEEWEVRRGTKVLSTHKKKDDADVKAMKHPLNKVYAKEDVPVNVAANVADPQNKRLFGQPMKRFKNFKAK